MVRVLFHQHGHCLMRGAHGVARLNTPDLQDMCLVVYGKSFGVEYSCTESDDHYHIHLEHCD